MIGNDIVDLAVANKESNWQRKGFFKKIFTSQEQKQILAAENQEIMVWILWSRKEAVYKIVNRKTQLRVFNPFQIACFDDCITPNFIYGKVWYEKELYHTKTAIHSDYIYTEAVSKREDFDKIIRISRPENVEKTEGIPNYLDTKSGHIRPLSITHHGRFERIITI